VYTIGLAFYGVWWVVAWAAEVIAELSAAA